MGVLLLYCSCSLADCPVPSSRARLRRFSIDNRHAAMMRQMATFQQVRLPIVRVDVFRVGSV